MCPHALPLLRKSDRWWETNDHKLESNSSSNRHPPLLESSQIFSHLSFFPQNSIQASSRAIMKHATTTMLAALATLAAGARVQIPVQLQYNVPTESSPTERGSPAQSVHRYPPGMAITIPTTSAHVQSTGGLFSCINDHFNPPCEHLSFPLDECRITPPPSFPRYRLLYSWSNAKRWFLFAWAENVRSDWNDKISAVGPDGGSTCIFYMCVHPLMTWNISKLYDWGAGEA